MRENPYEEGLGPSPAGRSVCYGERVHVRVRLGGITAMSVMSIACDPEPTAGPMQEPWPKTAACEGLDEWPQAWAELEEQTLDRIDALREEGADCGARGKHGPAPSLRRSAALDCAARYHARDMVEREYFRRLDPEGVDEWARVEAAGYEAAVVIQHMATGPRDASELVDQTWQPRPVPCSSLVSTEVTEVGLGLVSEIEGELTTVWVLMLATPGEAP